MECAKGSATGRVFCCALRGGCPSIRVNERLAGCVNADTAPIRGRSGPFYWLMAEAKHRSVVAEALTLRSPVAGGRWPADLPSDKSEV
jgi:hypothetical protein